MIKKYFWLIMLVVLLSVHTIANLIWITLNHGPVPWDSANHSYHTIKIAERLSDFNFIGALKTSNYYPIFIYLISAIPTIIVGPNLKLLQFLGTMYFVATLAGVFFYLKLLTKSAKIAFFSTLIFSFSAVIYNQSRLLMLDIPSVGLLVLSLILLLKSDHLRKRKPTIWFFASCALLGLTKWTAVFYLIVPTIYELIFFLRTKDKAKIFLNGILGVVVFALIFTPWYIANWADISYLGKVYAAGDKIANPQNPFSLDYILNYYKIYLYTQATPLPALFFFFTLVPFIYLKKMSYKWFVLLMITANYIFFSLITNKDGRFTMHLLIFTALITTVVLDRLEQYKKYLGNALLLGLSLFMFGYFMLMTIRPVALEGYKLKADLPLFGGLEFINVDDSVVKKIEPDDWQFSKLIPDLVELQHQEQKELKITVVSEWYHFNPSNIRTYAKVKDLDLVVVTPDLPFLIKEYESDHFPTEADLNEFIASKDYILAVEKNIGSPYLLNMQAELQLINALSIPNQCIDHTVISLAPGQKCIVRDGEVLTSGSDLLINGEVSTDPEKRIRDYNVIECPWGCTFGILEQNKERISVKTEAIKEYLLPNNEKVTLYKIVKPNEAN